jgi:hypothetical protein
MHQGTRLRQGQIGVAQAILKGAPHQARDVGQQKSKPVVLLGLQGNSPDVLHIVFFIY